MKVVHSVTEAIDNAQEKLAQDESDKARRIEKHLGQWKGAYSKIDKLHSMFMKIQDIMPNRGSKDD